MPSTELSEEKVYWIVRRALRDAVWNVIEIFMTVVITVLVLAIGAGFVAYGYRAAIEPTGWASIAFGGVVLVGAVVYLLREFRLFPFQ